MKKKAGWLTFALMAALCSWKSAGISLDQTARNSAAQHERQLATQKDEGAALAQSQIRPLSQLTKALQDAPQARKLPSVR